MNFQGVQDLIATAVSDKERSQLTSNSLLSSSLQEVIGKLKQNYDFEDPLFGKGLSATNSSNDSGYISSYQKMFEGVAESFASLGLELLKMRSSYLPYEFVSKVELEKGPEQGKSKKISEIVSADVTLESYENTFFRLLGMPLTSDIRDKMLVTVSKSGERLGPEKDADFQLTNKVLEKRLSRIGDRLDHPSSTAYDFLEGTKSAMDRIRDVGFTETDKLGEILAMVKQLNNIEERTYETGLLAAQLYEKLESYRKVDSVRASNQIQEMAQLSIQFGPISNDYHGENKGASTAYSLSRVIDVAISWLQPNLGPVITLDMKKHLWNEHVLVKQDNTMLDLDEPNNFWGYSYLLFPPVQDERISRCISEPSKMVAEPFLPESMRVVNGNRLKSTLLEAVIRIRLDVVSGLPNSLARLDPSGLNPASSDDQSSRPIRPDEMGLLESMLIVRLFEALYGLAKDARDKISVVNDAQHNTGRSPAGPAQTNEMGEASDHNHDIVTEKTRTPYQRALDSIILLEESMLLLFGDGSIPEALSMQEGVARNAGVKSAHMMGAAISVLDVPRRWAQQELSKIKEKKDRDADKVIGPGSVGVRSVMGVAKGVGTVDLLAYLLALFTAGEETLLALLNDRQFEYLKAEFPKGYFDDFDRNAIETGAAVCEIADRYYDAYQLFRFALSAGESTFTFPTLLAVQLETQ